ncbi:MAG TPA: nucleotidyl transferase AbiEii/AbiGii toxin family protein [Rhodothermales bacterium]|nr:nucleotidyl transferase AbiEii/AbiGii toxin family protein [Rhodothermales bacterium]
MPSPKKTDVAGLISRITRELRSRRLTFMIIGGQAVLLHGRPRATEDIDIVVGTDPSGLTNLLEACAVLDLVVLADDVESFVQRSFVLPVADESTGIRVDFIFSSTRFEKEAIERVELVELEGESVPFASVEDLIILKLIAGRAVDLQDAAAVVRRKGEEIDWPYVSDWVNRFAQIEGHEHLTERLRELRRA